MKIEYLIQKQIHIGMEQAKKEIGVGLSRWEYKINPFILKEFVRGIFVNREEEISRVARSIGRGSQGSSITVALIGPFGCGITTILSAIHDTFEKKDLGIRGIYDLGSRFLESREVEEEGEKYLITFFDQRLDSINYSKATYHVIDEIEPIATELCDYINQLEDHAKAYNNRPVLIFGMHISGWLSLSPETRDRFTEQIWVPPLEKEDCIRMLENHILWAKSDGDLEPFTRDTLELIMKYGAGIPKSTVELANKVLQECIKRDLSKIDSELVHEVAKLYGYNVISKTFLGGVIEGEVRKKILELLVKYRKGLSASTIAEVTREKRNTISYHLVTLEEMGLLLRERKGRQVLYSFKAPARSAIETMMFIGQRWKGD